MKPKLTTNRKLQQRLVRTFLLQALLIAMAAVLGIYITNWLLSNLLVEEALRRETHHYWQLLAENPHTAMPNSLNLRGYLLPRDASPSTANFHQLALGYHSFSDKAGFNSYFASQQNDQQLYLFFNRSQVDSLITLYGIGPLVVVLVLLYLATYVTYRVANRAISPTVALANQVKSLDPTHPDKSSFALDQLPGPVDSEVASLASAFEDFVERISGFMERERNFTRDASHELRTPITVIHMAADILASDTGLSPANRRLVARIERACRDMQELTDAFLLLAREQEIHTVVEPVLVNNIVAEELIKLAEIADAKGISLQFDVATELWVSANPKMLQILLGNLLRNAVYYTDEGQVSVSLEEGKMGDGKVGDGKLTEGKIVIRDTGRGIDQHKIHDILRPYVRDNDNSHPGYRSGYGVGLSIVKRLCDQFGWDLQLMSDKGQGTQVSIGFQ